MKTIEVFLTPSGVARLLRRSKSGSLQGYIRLNAYNGAEGEYWCHLSPEEARGWLQTGVGGHLMDGTPVPPYQ